MGIQIREGFPLTVKKITREPTSTWEEEGFRGKLQNIPGIERGCLEKEVHVEIRFSSQSYRRSGTGYWN